MPAKKKRGGPPAKEARKPVKRKIAPTEADYRESLDYEASGADMLHLVGFYLNGALYGSEIGYVEEVIKPRDIAELPNMPPYVGGVISLRGEMIVTVDMKERLSLAAGRDEGERMVIVGSGECKAALIVDRMASIIEMPAAMVSIASSGSTDSLIKDTVSIDNMTVNVIDMNRLLDPASLSGS